VDGTDSVNRDDLTRYQRFGRRRMVRFARKHGGEGLDPWNWEYYFRYSAQPSTRAMKWMLRSLPASPRCGYCGAPFSGWGGAVVRPLGYRPSRKNPNLCAACVEASPPGGANLEIGVLFADVRGFTTFSESAGTTEATKVLRRFYAHAESVFFPEALIDKFIGDEVMALYVPWLIDSTIDGVTDEVRANVTQLMLEHAKELLGAVGYGSETGPEVDIGIGMDFGEAFLGHVGSDAVHDFTAIGDVVNTASRLQGQAASGEVVLSERVACHLAAAAGVTEQVTLKGKAEPVTIQRVRWF